jgi:hypothetical protein
MAKAQDKPATLLEQLITSIFTPGVGVTTLKVINAALVGVFITLVFMAAIGYANIHVMVMGGLAVGFALSVNWMFFELGAAGALKGQRNTPDNKGE